MLVHESLSSALSSRYLTRSVLPCLRRSDLLSSDLNLHHIQPIRIYCQKPAPDLQNQKGETSATLKRQGGHQHLAKIVHLRYSSIKNKETCSMICIHS